MNDDKVPPKIATDGGMDENSEETAAASIEESDHNMDELGHLFGQLVLPEREQVPEAQAQEKQPEKDMSPGTRRKLTMVNQWFTRTEQPHESLEEVPAAQLPRALESKKFANLFGKLTFPDNPPKPEVIETPVVLKWPSFNFAEQEAAARRIPRAWTTKLKLPDFELAATNQASRSLVVEPPSPVEQESAAAGEPRASDWPIKFLKLPLPPMIEFPQQPVPSIEPGKLASELAKLAFRQTTEIKAADLPLCKLTPRMHFPVFGGPKEEPSKNDDKEEKIESPKKDTDKEKEVDPSEDEAVMPTAGLGIIPKLSIEDEDVSALEEDPKE